MRRDRAVIRADSLAEGLGEVGEERVLVLGVLLRVLLELLVGAEGHIGPELSGRNESGDSFFEERAWTDHHETLVGLVLELGRALPLALLPLLVKEQAEVLVPARGTIAVSDRLDVPVSQKRTHENVVGAYCDASLHQHPIKLASGDGTAHLPRAVKARAVGVAAAERVRTREGDNLLVSKAHAVEDVPDVVGALVAIRKAAVRGAVLDVAASVTESGSVRGRTTPTPVRDHSPILTASPPGDVRATELLHSANTGEGLESGVWEYQ